MSIIGESEHKKRATSILNAVLGILSSASLIIHRIGRGLSRLYGLNDKHAIKQVDRLLSNKKLDPENFFAVWVPYLIAQRQEVKVIMDWTDFDADGQCTIQLSISTAHGRATPLIWKTVKKTDLKYRRLEYEQDVLELLKKHAPSTAKITILADRGFGDVEHYHYIKEILGFDYIIRFKANIYVIDATGEMRLASEWVPQDGSIKTLRNVKVTLQKQEVATCVCVRDINMKDAWCIASSLDDLSGSGIVRWYSKRWGCEPQFRDTKDHHFGMGLSETTIQEPQRRDRLFIIHALATAYLTLLGAAGENLGFDKQLKANTAKKRVLSLLKQGCIYFNKLTTYPKQKVEQLLIEFSHLLESQWQLKEILAWI